MSLYSRLPRKYKQQRKTRWKKYRKDNKSWKKTAQVAAETAGWLVGDRFGSSVARDLVNSTWRRPTRYGYKNVIGSAPKRVTGSAPHPIYGTPYAPGEKRMPSPSNKGRPQVKKFYRYQPRLYFKRVRK